MLNKKYRFISDGKIVNKTKVKKKVEPDIIERKITLRIESKNNFGVIERDVIIKNTNREIKKIFEKKEKDEEIVRFIANSRTIIYLTRYSDSVQQDLRNNAIGYIRNIVVEGDENLEFLNLIIVTKYKKAGNLRHRYISRRQ